MSENIKLLDFLRLLPKVELHRHLVGSIRVETLFDIAIKKGISLPTNDFEKLKNSIEISKPCSNLRQFLSPLKILGLCFFDKETVARVAYEVVEDAAKDNIKYLELATGPAFEASFYRLSLEDVLEGVIEGVMRAEEKYDIRVHLIVGPTFKWMERKAHSPEEVLEVALQYRNKVAGFGLGAETKEGLPFSKWGQKLRKRYIELAGKAKDGGLAVTVHAGEVGDAQSVFYAVKYLKADRIGHGIKLVEDSAILKNIVKMRLPLEICVSSNILSGVVKSLRQHPVRRLWEHGALITVNTDDPTLCKTTLTKEYNILIKNLGFSYFELKKLIFNAINSAFLMENEKVQLCETFKRSFAKLEECVNHQRLF